MVTVILHTHLRVDNLYITPMSEFFPYGTVVEFIRNFEGVKQGTRGVVTYASPYDSLRTISLNSGKMVRLYLPALTVKPV